MRIIELSDPVTKFFGDVLDSNPEVLWTAAFESDLYGQPTSNRPAGVHLSAIIHHIYEKVESPNRDESEEGLTTKNLKMATGIGWEYILSLVIGRVFPAQKIIYPGYFESDGVVMNPDRYDYEDNLVEEWKGTWYSLKKARTPDDFRRFFWWWIMQVQAYCRVLDTRKARFRVLFINGDYAPPRPRPKQWSLEFSRTEIEDNWQVILRTGREMGLLK